MRACPPFGAAGGIEAEWSSPPNGRLVRRSINTREEIDLMTVSNPGTGLEYFAPSSFPVEDKPESVDVAAGSESLVRFCDVQKSYDGTTLVVRGLNLSVNEGEFLTLLGPSGSGKTSCLMMLAGFEPVTRGEILLDGHSLKNVSPQRRNIGMVFQNYALFPHMTVAENVAFPLEVRRLRRAEVRAAVERALSMVRLEGFEQRRPAQLSGGQQQRVALARALVYGPKIILMDEPLGALDKKLREEMQLEIKHLHESLGVTIVYVTHDQSEALTMSDRIAVFHEGVIQQIAEPNEIYERPANAFVAQFIGESNIMVGTVASMEESICHVELAGGDLVSANPVGVSINDVAVLSLRPERVQVGTASGDAQLRNAFRGEVEEIIYLGDHVRVRLRVLDRTDFVVRITDLQLVERIERGSLLEIGWSAEACRAFPRQAAEGEANMM